MLLSDKMVIFSNIPMSNKPGFTTRVKIGDPLKWISCPVVKSKYLCESTICDIIRFKKILKTLEYTYKKSKYYDKITPLLSYLSSISEGDKYDIVSYTLISMITDILGIKDKLGKLVCNGDLDQDPTLRLINCVKSEGGSSYLSGPDGPKYMDLSLFPQNDMELKVQDPYPVENYPGSILKLIVEEENPISSILKYGGIKDVRT